MDRGRECLRYTVCFALLVAAVLVLLFVNLVTGSVALTPDEIWGSLTGRGEGAAAMILLTIRLPRLLAALVLGGGLALSGFLLQTYFNNPIAGPFVLGISSGAKLVIAFLMIGSLEMGRTVSAWGMIGGAFAGAMLTMGFILLVSSHTRRSSVLIICGVMVGYFCTAVTDFMVTFASDANIVNLHNWSRGSFSGMTWGNLGVMSAVTLVCLVAAFLLAKPMAAFQLGETAARSLGVNTGRLKVALILIASLLAACVTAFAGPISFVGIAVPQVMKRMFRSARPILMVPASFLGGGIFCLFSDLLARTLFAPTELSVSTVTAAFGAPIVVWVMLKRRSGENG